MYYTTHLITKLVLGIYGATMGISEPTNRHTILENKASSITVFS